MFKAIWIHRWSIAAIIAIGCGVVLSGCNTMAGMGEDVAWVGNSLSETAEDVGSD